MAVVLLVDDDPEITEMGQTLLTVGGFDVIAKNAGEAALDVLRAGTHVDAIVCDYLMPGMTGLDFLRTVQREQLFSGLFVVITGFPDRIAALDAHLGRGLERVFIKPVGFFDLARYLKEKLPGNLENSSC